jgi:hypothetical protein
MDSPIVMFKPLSFTAQRDRAVALALLLGSTAACADLKTPLVSYDDAPPLGVWQSEPARTTHSVSVSTDVDAGHKAAGSGAAAVSGTAGRATRSEEDAGVEASSTR